MDELEPMDPGEAAKCLAAFEDHIRQDKIRGIIPEHFLTKLESYDQLNPAFLDKGVDSEWVIWRAAWLSCCKHKEPNHNGAAETPQTNQT